MSASTPSSGISSWSAAPMRGLLAHLHARDEPARGRHIKTSEPILDRDDEFLPSADGMWAGEREFQADDPAWAPRVHPCRAQQPLFSIRTYLGEAELRPCGMACLGAG